MQSVIDIVIDNRHKKYDLNSFGKEVVSFGRSSECDIQIPKNYISRVHGCFYLENGEWFVKDMESTNGIFFNSNKIDALRLAVGPVKISKNLSSEDYIMISLEGAGGFQPQQTPQFGAQQRMPQAPMGGAQQRMPQNQFGGQPMPQNQFGAPMGMNRPQGRAIDVGWGLKIAMICFCIVSIVSCFLPFCKFGGVGSALGSWGKYIDDAVDSYTKQTLFTDSYFIMGSIVVLNSILLIVFSILSHIYGLSIAAMIIGFFNPLWAIFGLVMMKKDSFGLTSASIGFYLLLASSIGAMVVAIIIRSKASKQRKAALFSGFGYQR